MSMMPSFYNTNLSQHMPLTPPRIFGPCLDRGQAFVQQPSLQPDNHKAADPYYGNRCREDLAPAKQRPQYRPAAASRPFYHATMDGAVAPVFPAPLLTSSNQYGPSSGPPLLPPIRAPERSSDGLNRPTQSTYAPAVTQVKEEKVGGVAAHLDYEMDEMVDFVSEMAQGMYEIFASKICLADIDMTRSVLSSRASPHREFRKYVSQVLSSTRLPSSTILCGLMYLSKRMTLLSNNGRYGQGTRDTYSMLTTALMLGSKFLDDNTFQNRSWSEVSNIPVSDLNFLEIQWLVDINWDMHIDQSNPEGLSLWLKTWDKYHSRNEDVSLAASMRQTHIENNGQQKPQQRPVPQLPPLNTQYLHMQPDPSSRVSFTSQGSWDTPRHSHWQQPRSQINYSPPSAPETGPNTPDACNLLNAYAYATQPVHPTFKLPASLHMLPSSASHSGYPTPYTPKYSHYGHGSCCDCSFCRSHYERYLMAPGYGPQPMAA